jgi:hypothetical protein
MEAEGPFPPEGASEEQQETAEPLVRHERRTCRIERWRGYLTSRFYVVTDEATLIESRPFRWGRPEPPPESKNARAAYDQLVERLQAEGWTRLEEGRVWYATTFGWTPGAPAGRRTDEAEREVTGPAKSETEARAAELEPQQGEPRRRRRHRTVLLGSIFVAVASTVAAFLVGGGHANAGPPVSHHHGPPAATTTTPDLRRPAGG